MRIQNTVNYKSNLLYLILLTSFLLLIEVSFFIQSNEAYFSDFNYVSTQIHLPLSIWPSILFFITAQLGLHLGFCLLVWMAACLISALFNFNATQQLYLSIGLWVLSTLTIIVANFIYFPNAKIATLLLPVLSLPVAVIIFFALKALMLVVVMLSLFQLIKRHPYIVLPLLISGFVYYHINQYYLAEPKVVQDVATEARPNIILIGVDSLRSDHLSFFGGDHATPFFDGFLARSTVFAEAVTPLARTFPSWVSILTGQYPKQVNIRSNLANQTHAKFKQSLPVQLQHAGYQTIYATDETRFSNITTQLGFDQLITPPVGLLDFLLGTFNDFPLSNLIVNTFVGHWLFPYSYANRPVYVTYQPNSFLKLMQPYLEANRTKPVFLAVHFCLPHYPYLYADMPSELNWQARYQASIAASDKQLTDFYIMLREANLLKHAIVVLLSDHGETLEIPGDRITESDLYVGKGSAPHFYPPSDYPESVDQAGGHGTDVLGLPQYHSLLAFTSYGLGKQSRKTVGGVVSLLDIKPTILEWVLKQKANTSLMSVIKDRASTVPTDRHIFLESDFSPSSLRAVYPQTQKVLLEGVQLFQVDPRTSRLTIKDPMMQMIIASKQYADIYQGWMLALYPQANNKYTTILINLATGQWTNDLTSPFALTSPANVMLLALKMFYGREISDTCV